MEEIIASTYKIIKKLGSGGGGNVFLANHLRLSKLVVLKADKRKISTRPELLRREVDVLKTLKHPYIPQVYDFFTEGETAYTVMDYVEGESLDRPLKRGETFPQAQVVEWAIELLDALAYLHDPTHGDPPRGFTHSDIKPANIMRTPDNRICLIDFNIALALGEENVVGRSPGYASPEHYGLDFSTDSSETAPAGETTVYVPTGETTVSATGSNSSSGSSPRVKIITPDVRSDIYSVGATLYHLLCGRRPAENAKEVAPLSEKEFSPQVVRIITKAMQPNPDLRYQSAREMLRDLTGLHQNDPRVIRQRRLCRIGVAALSVLLCVGVGTAFVGLKRMQTTESWLKLAEYSKNALQRGDVGQAIQYALQAYPEKATILTPAAVPQVQEALTEALGVYDLADDYQPIGSVELPAAPIFLRLAPDGKTAACIYAQGLAVIDTGKHGILKTLPTEGSAFDEVEYLDESTLVFAGERGLTAYDIQNDEILWTGQPATAVCVSADGGTVAAVYKTQDKAVLYDAATGTVRCTVSFRGRGFTLPENDTFANPNDDLFALNRDGTLLGASFSDGSLGIFDTKTGEETQLMGKNSGYSHFEGGFSKEYFAFSASDTQKSVFAVVETENGSQTGGFQDQMAYSVQTDEDGIYLQAGNLLVDIDPVTGDQTPLVTTSKSIRTFSRGTRHTLVATEDSFDFYNGDAMLISENETQEQADFVQTANGTALVANRDSPQIRILAYEDHRDAELFTYESYPHDEARLSADGRTVMLFSYEGFRVYSVEGELINESSIPDAALVYDQQYIRQGERSYLDIIYHDGTLTRYDGGTGEIVSRTAGEKPDETMQEEFLVGELRIESPLHGTPTVYNAKTGKRIAQLDSEAYLTYVTQAGKYLVAQYVGADGEVYGELLDQRCERSARLPYLCDVIDDTLIFDYPTGNLRKTRIYNIEELIQQAKAQEKGQELDG